MVKEIPKISKNKCKIAEKCPFLSKILPKISTNLLHFATLFLIFFIVKIFQKIKHLKTDKSKILQKKKDKNSNKTL